MSTQLIACLVIFAIMVVGFCFSHRINMAVTAIFCMVALTITGCMTASEALAYFSNSNIIMIAGMCIVAAGFNRTQFCMNIANRISSVAKGSLTKVLVGYVLIAMLLAQFIQSAIVVFGIVSPMLVASAKSLGVCPSKVAFPVGIVIIITICTLPLGAGATVAAEFNGYLESYGYTAYPVGLFDPMVGRLPLLIICVLYCIFLAPKFAPDKYIIDSSSSTKVSTAVKKDPLKPFQEYAGLVIFFGDAIALMFAAQLGLDNWQITVIGALAMVLCGVLNPKEATDALPMDILLLIAGSLAVSGALSSTGAGDLMGNFLSSLLDVVGRNSYVVGAVFFLVAFVMTQFMNNRSTMMIFYPIAIATCSSMGANPIGLMTVIQAACQSSFMTPMATAVIPYIMECGGYDQKSLIKQSLPISIICFAVSVFWIMTVRPLF